MRTPNPTAERRFYIGMSIAILVLVFLGFSQSFYLRPLFPDNPAASYTMVFIHGAIFSLWVITFVVQVLFIKKHLIRWHRTLGWFAAVLAVIMVVQGLDMAFETVRVGRVDARFGGPLPLILPVVDALLFSTFVLLGIMYRNKAQRHKRLMLLATFNLIGPAINRLPGAMALGPAIPIGIFALLVVALAIWDVRSRGKLHPVTLIGGLISILSLPLRFIFSETAIWQTFEQWVIAGG